MSTRWARDPEVMCTEIEHGAVLLDPRTRRMFDLNRTGTIVWRTIDDGIDEAVSRVVSTFGVDEAIARSDVEALVARLADAGLVTRRA